MRIVVALSRFPWPTDKGDKLRAFEQIKGLSKNNEIHLICLNEKKVTEEQLAKVSPFCTSVQIIYLPKTNILINLIWGIFNFLPLQVNYFRSAKMKAAIDKTCKEKQVDVIYVQLIRLGLNLPKIQIPMYLDYMDCLSNGMANRIPFANFYEKPVMEMEASRLRRYEKNIAPRFSGWSVISKADARSLPGNLENTVSIIPNGVSPDFFNWKKTPGASEFDIIFTGNMGYRPNILAANHLIEVVLPLLILRGLNPKICIAGANPPTELKEKGRGRIVVTGWVKDLREYIGNSRLYVAPMISGSGLQNKLLEAMAMGLPVFTSPLANDALGAKDGVEIVVCDSAKDFGKKITQFSSDVVELQKLAAAGKEFVKKNFNWDDSNSKLEKDLHSLLQSERKNSN